jgi:hypothetical protein
VRSLVRLARGFRRRAKEVFASTLFGIRPAMEASADEQPWLAPPVARVAG